jgi:phosphoenolpyruvate carboxylase
MAERRVHFDPKDEPLRADVSLLGGMVGEMLREQGGEELFARVEGARRAAIELREGVEGSEGGLRRTVCELGAGQAEELVRAFSTYFRVVNLAEKIHRIRRRRDYLRQQGPPQPESLEAACRRLAELGVEAEEVQELLDRLVLEPVFTAHPTEATRRAILEKEQRLARLLTDRLDGGMTPPEDRSSRARIFAEITTAWQTDEHSEVRPTVADEREHVLFFLTDVLYRIVPPFFELLETALSEAYPGRRFRLPSPLRFGSWVGGDMDGNPNVTAQTLRESLEHHHRLALGRYTREVRGLASHLTQSPRRVKIADAVLARSNEYAELFPEVRETLPRRHRDMPYRTYLHFVAHRLEKTAGADEGGYRSAGGLVEDLRVVAASLSVHQGEHAGLFAVERLLRRIDTFGFHLATLDVRQDALVHRRVVGEVVGDATWEERTVAERSETLRSVVREGGAPRRLPESDAARKTFEVFRAISAGRRRFGEAALGPYIVSMARDVDDVLSVLALARWAAAGEDGPGGHDALEHLDVAPLFETVPDLERAPRVLDALFGDPVYRVHLRRRDDSQMVMVGYSDSSKDGGIAASRWALQRAIEEMVQVARRHAVRVLFFHGRGGTVGRGGGKTHRAVLAAPAGSVAGRLRVTEQGEVIDERYGMRGIALRELERMAGAVALASLERKGRGSPLPDWRETMESVARESRRAYRGLVYEEPRFVSYFRTATPIDVIERLPIGSRPPSRRSGDGVENLRAIPWVFSWTQSRHLLPGWFGLGSGLAAARETAGATVLAEMAGGWLFFHCLLDDVEMALAKADMTIARSYAGLAPDDSRPLFGLIEDEYRRTVEAVLALKGTAELLDGDVALKRSIRLRNPYVDPMSLLQVDLLARWRESEREDDELFRALVATVHGISEGLQNTG